VIRSIRAIQKENAAQSRPTFSIEFFPPKSPEGDVKLLTETVPHFRKLPVDYCSVTYGAGGSTRDKTLDLVEAIQKQHDLTALMHLTCVNATQEEIAAVVEEARHRGILNLLALRGDPPGGTGGFTKTPGGFEYSRELVEFLHQQGRWTIGTAGFPEGHIAQTEGKQVDWDFLAEKIRSGADFVVTQLFFDNEAFYEFRDYLTEKHHVDVPIIAGLLPVVSRNQTRRFVDLCGAKLPKSFSDRLDALGDDDEATTQFGIDYCVEQCQDLLRNGVPGIHFYTLNRTHSTSEILTALTSSPNS
jgi:methylenetetrahydrofolate reductase (NADPH)